VNKPGIPGWVKLLPIGVLLLFMIGFAGPDAAAVTMPLTFLAVIGVTVVALRRAARANKTRSQQFTTEAAAKWVEESSTAAQPRAAETLKSANRPEAVTLLLLGAGGYYMLERLGSGAGPTTSGNISVGLAVIITVFAWRGWRNWRLGVLMSDTPTSPPHAVAAGRTETTGTATLPANAAGLGHDNAVWCRYRIEELVRGRRSSHWVKRAEIVSDRAFYVSDTDGAIAVLPAGADTDIEKEADEGIERLSIAQLQGLAAADPTETRLDVNRPIGMFRGNWRVLYASIREGEEITVYGPVLSDAWNDGEPAFRQDPKTSGIKGRVHFAHGGVKEREKRLKRNLWTILAAPVALPLASPLLALPGALIVYPAVIVTLLLDVYNRLVALSNQIDATGALIDVTLTRRADLIGNLQVSVAAALEHEFEIQTRLAAARNYLTRREMGTAADVRVAAELRLLAERYPDLQTEKNFLKLMQEVVKSENLVAASRNVHNQAVGLMRTRIGSFPYNVFAAKFKNRVGQYFII